MRAPDRAAAYASTVRAGRRAAIGLSTLGGLAIAWGFWLEDRPFEMSPGLDAALTCGLAGFWLLLLSGHGLKLSLGAMAPVMGLQAGMFLLLGRWPFAQLGLEAMLMGLSTLLLATLAARAEKI